MGRRGSGYGWDMETMEVASVRRGVDGCWREDEIYSAHTLLGGDGRGDKGERDTRNVTSESVETGKATVSVTGIE